MKSRFLFSMLTVLFILAGGLSFTAEAADPGVERSDVVTVDEVEAQEVGSINSFILKQNQQSTMPNSTTYTVTTPNPHFTGVREGVQFQKGEGEADEATAKRLVNIWGYDCSELESPEDDAGETETVTVQEFGDEEVEMTQKDGVAYPKPDNTNAGLKAFMDAHEIDYESDDNKADLNAKISDWVEEQTADVKSETAADDSDENDESGEADSQPENGK